MSGFTPPTDASTIKGQPFSNTEPSTNDVLVWNGSAWEPGAISGSGISDAPNNGNAYIRKSEGWNLLSGEGYAPLTSPALTGNPTATTQSTSDNSTRLATTAFVTSKFGEFESPWIILPTTEPFVIASAPTYTTTYTFPAISEGTSYVVTYECEFATRALATGVVRSAKCVLIFNIVRNVGSYSQVAANATTQTNGSFGSLNAQVITNFTTSEFSTQVRFSGGATGQLKHRYRATLMNPVAV